MIEMRHLIRVFHAIEIKTGKAKLSNRQNQIFPQIEAGDAFPVGKNSEKFDLKPDRPIKYQEGLKDIPVKIRTFPGAGQ